MPSLPSRYRRRLAAADLDRPPLSFCALLSEIASSYFSSPVFAHLSFVAPRVRPIHRRQGRTPPSPPLYLAPSSYGSSRLTPSCYEEDDGDKEEEKEEEEERRTPTSRRGRRRIMLFLDADSRRIIECGRGTHIRRQQNFGTVFPFRSPCAKLASKFGVFLEPLPLVRGAADVIYGAPIPPTPVLNARCPFPH